MMVLPRKLLKQQLLSVTLILFLLADGILAQQQEEGEGTKRYLEAANFEHEALESVDLFLAILMRIVTVSVAVALGIPVLVSAIANNLLF